MTDILVNDAPPFTSVDDTDQIAGSDAAKAIEGDPGGLGPDRATGQLCW